MADRTGFFVVDYDDRTTCATRYLARCTHEKTTELRGYECREHAEAAARKWLGDRLGSNVVPVPVAPKSGGSDSFEKGISACIGLTNALLRATTVSAANYDSDRDVDQAVNVMEYRSSLLVLLLRSYELELDAIRLKRDPDYYTKAKHGD
jgi:hypothetical protein